MRSPLVRASATPAAWPGFGLAGKPGALQSLRVIDLSRVGALAQVLLIDLTLAGDNAVVVGLAVIGLPPRLRTRAVALGVLAATAIRIGLALVAVRLLAVIGLTLAGGLLLLWVAWRSFRELRARHEGDDARGPPASFAGAMTRIIVADVSMSLDNVLAVAGAAHADRVALVTGLVFSVLLMGVAASFVARLLQRFRWVAFVGIAIVLFVALRMIWDGGGDVLRHATGEEIIGHARGEEIIGHARGEEIIGHARGDEIARQARGVAP